MKKISLLFAGGALCALAVSFGAIAQDASSRHPMTFFVTSVGLPGGADLHGLAGADAHCTDLARAATGDRTLIWHAYLSTQARPGRPAINARDRIGTGPWYNAAGVMIAKDVADLHGDHNNLHRDTMLTERGRQVPANVPGDDPRNRSWTYMQAHPNSLRHEILTGTQPDGRAFPPGRDHTCNNWTSEEEGNAPINGPSRFNTGPGAEVGKSDGSGPWNSQHVSGGCSHEALARGHGAGLFYCFAVNP